MSIYFDKVPPQNIEAEQLVLGAMLIDRESIPVVMGILQADDFFREGHRLVYSAIIGLFERGDPVDLVTLAEEFRRLDELDRVGGLPYLAFLITSVPTSVSVEHHASIVKEKALLRALINLSNRLVNRSYEGREDIQVLLDEAEQQITEISQRGVMQSFASLQDILLETYDRLQQLQEQGNRATGLPTYYPDLDRLLGGLQPGELILLAARPAMGKTSLSLNIAQNVALRAKLPVAIFSLEMAKEQLVQRMLCAEARLDQGRFRTGRLAEDEWVSLTRAMGLLAEAPIYIDDTPAISVNEMRSKARRLKAVKGLALLVVDYLQLIQTTRRFENRTQEISEISRFLKALARELAVPVLALSQLSRAVEQTQDKRPNLSHLRESGALEQDSDIVLFIYRHDYYFADSDKPNIAEIIIAKHRNGPTGSVELAFLKEFTKFVNLLKEPMPG
ncbi:MAG: replicative DNA helicase [Syntrophomonadaceae bacterium]|nr:replicative DNA helicase [Syntrophomonadaceae bacterium]